MFAVTLMCVLLAAAVAPTAADDGTACAAAYLDAGSPTGPKLCSAIATLESCLRKIDEPATLLADRVLKNALAMPAAASCEISIAVSRRQNFGAPELKTRANELLISAKTVGFEFERDGRREAMDLSDLMTTTEDNRKESDRVRKDIGPKVEANTADVVDLSSAVTYLSRRLQLEEKAGSQCPTACEGLGVEISDDGECVAPCRADKASIKELEATVQRIAAQSAGPFWASFDSKVLPLRNPEIPVTIIGFNLDGLYHPKLADTFTCAWTFAAGNKVETTGTVDKVDEHYHIACNSPPNVAKKTTATLEILNSLLDTGSEKITFAGQDGQNEVLFADNWYGYHFDGNLVIIEAEGLSSKRDYECTFQDANGKGNTQREGKVLPGETRLNCGAIPTDFKIFEDYVKVKVSIKDAVANEDLEYGGSGLPHINMPICVNGKKDPGESDVDCGGVCVTGTTAVLPNGGACDAGKKCSGDGDCPAGIPCTTGGKNICGMGDGKSKDNPGWSCKALRDQFDLGRNGGGDDGVYWINGIDYAGGPRETYCRMDRKFLGGGWTAVAKMWYTGDQGGNSGMNNVNGKNFGHARDVTAGPKGNAYALDQLIMRHIIGPTELFDVLAMQTGTNTHYSSGNYEYVTIENYKGKWSWNPKTPESKQATVMRSWRTSDHREAWRGELRCNANGKYGINCYETRVGNPQGGCGCNFHMGRYCSSGWHHFYMADSNSDTYLYLCNGPQHSSSYNMNHYFFLREQVDLYKSD